MSFQFRIFIYLIRIPVNCSTVGNQQMLIFIFGAVQHVYGSQTVVQVLHNFKPDQQRIQLENDTGHTGPRDIRGVKALLPLIYNDF